ncbi:MULTISPECIES: TipC family immunity protein [unclassified Streptococcus]|uniref:TipC family immunity protein n=1 Tax=unclassified Streptococcus TaxID=2608887 RepID=UPI0010720034|nr:MULTISPECIES: TipC family immunity protein [unclassified Streptococcus]MBF0786548.1 TipC family immunity protein [Streptococcus sp. 19428wC2_LYSM12]MCQ9210960.1 TipC family immunity protein [Streptococcus sp. B01]MCQ9214229.1 TipC family immunity protein [Streptococcus sp. O1]TFV06513.1 hypothetical protein E4T79_01210 [Streptococcus sp. LYSM12]
MKYLKIIIGFLSIPVMVIVGWYMVTYTSLKNPIDEMIYSEITRFKIVGVPEYSYVVNSPVSYDVTDNNHFTILNYRLKNLNKNESAYIYIDDLKKFIFTYQFNLIDNKVLIIEYSYQLADIEKTIYIKDENNIRIAEYDNILKLLSENNLNKEWLRNRSNFVFHDMLLQPWFEKGSQRYSFEDLGNLKIEESELLK